MIIPTLNAGPNFEELLLNLQQQVLKPNEILVIDSGSSDQTTTLAGSLGARVVTIPPGSFDHGGTRNLAAEYAHGDILIYMTQDALPVDKQTLKTLINPLQEEKTVVSYARQKAAETAKLSEKYLRLDNYPPCSQLKSLQQVSELGIRAFQSSNVCAAYRRAEFEALGRFPAPVVCNEDMLFATRALFAGYKVAYTAEAEVWHTHNNSCLELFRRYFDIAASLDYEPRIHAIGNAETKGLEFLKKQICYARGQRKHHELPRIILESTAKYLGYKTGANHTRIPTKIKKHLALNRAYWMNIEQNNKDGKAIQTEPRA